MTKREIFLHQKFPYFLAGTLGNLKKYYSDYQKCDKKLVFSNEKVYLLKFLTNFGPLCRQSCDISFVRPKLEYFDSNYKKWIVSIVKNSTSKEMLEYKIRRSSKEKWANTENSSELAAVLNFSKRTKMEKTPFNSYLSVPAKFI